MTNSSIMKEIGDIINRYNSFLVVAHKNPDGDAVGSSLAMYSLLKELGKEVYIENPTDVPSVFQFLEDYDKIELLKNNKDVDVVIALDTAEIGRCGIKEEYVKDKIFINIDHHKTNTEFGHINLVVDDAAAVGCILWDIFELNGFNVSAQTAQYLYVSILTDTGSFRYSSTTPKTLNIAAELLKRDIDPWFIAYNIYESNKLKTLRLLGLVLDTLETYYDGKLAIEYVTLDMFNKANAQIEDSEGFVNYARSVRGAEVGVLLREDKTNEFKISMRSKGNVDVSKAALLFGGGGHKNAAGGEINGTLDEVKQRIIDSFAFLS
jgi:phosphoesterase RecJ-like protein